MVPGAVLQFHGHRFHAPHQQHAANSSSTRWGVSSCCPYAWPLWPLVLADYINFMKQVTPETTQEYMTQLKRFNMGAPGESDCPVFDGMYEYFAVSTEPQTTTDQCLAPVSSSLAAPAVQYGLKASCEGGGLTLQLQASFEC